MSLAWAWALIAVLAAPLLLLFRWWAGRRRRREVVRLPSVALVRAALPGRSSWRRRIPVALFVSGLVVLGLGAARPQASVLVPSDASSILLAIDVSGSMCSTDVDPNRLTVAQEAARRFVEAQDDGTRIGIVAFSAIAGLIVPPTTDQDQLLEAIDGLTTSRGTAIGQAILASVDAIAEINPQVAPTGVEVAGSDSGADPEGGSGEGAGDGPGPSDELTAYQPDTIVVLTDGANSEGVDPVTAAEQAAARDVRVYTIGFGTTEPASMVCTADQLGGDSPFGFGGGSGGGFGGGDGRRAQIQQLDEETLSRVADLTGGEYFRAQDADQLNDVLLDLPSTIVRQQKDVELTVWFALVGALLVATALGSSLAWNRPRPVTH